MTQLSEHFSLKELTVSDTAARMGREIVPTPDQLENLKRLCASLLEPIRLKLGRPIVVTSGLRPPWLNTLIGGSPKSAHMDGLAADINAVGMDADSLAKWIMEHQFVVDQCISEFSRWVHVSIAPAERPPRGEWLVAKNVTGRIVYEVMI